MMRAINKEPCTATAKATAKNVSPVGSKVNQGTQYFIAMVKMGEKRKMGRLFRPT